MESNVWYSGISISETSQLANSQTYVRHFHLLPFFQIYYINLKSNIVRFKRKTNWGFLNRDLPVSLFSSKYHIKRPFSRLKIARFFSRWHGWDSRGVVWISLFLTCGANNCSMVRNERVTFNCKVTFVQDLFHCHVLGGPAFKSSQVPNASLTFFPTSYLRWWPRLLVSVHS